MTTLYAVATLWLGLAVLSTILANHLRLSMALVEICIGVAAGYAARHWFHSQGMPGGDAEWLKFLASLGSVMLTFLAGAELEPSVIRAKAKEVSVVGLVGFFAPFLGCAAVARYLLHWDPQASWLAGVALSTTSMAVVYAVMLETGFNRTDYGKGILGACFINDLGTVIALGLLFAPFTRRTGIFVASMVAALALLPFVTKRLAKRYGFRTAAIRTKWVLLILLGLGALSQWAESEAVLPAYLAGMVLAGAAAEDHQWVRRIRTLTVGLLTPFYFLRAGSIVAISSVVAGPLAFFALLGGKVGAKIFGLYPVVAAFREGGRGERTYYTLLMSTGLTFGTISSLYGLMHGIVTRDQYSWLVAVVIASAVVPTAIANAFYLPKHLLVEMLDEEEEEPQKNGAT